MTPEPTPADLVAIEQLIRDSARECPPRRSVVLLELKVDGADAILPAEQLGELLNHLEKCDFDLSVASSRVEMLIEERRGLELQNRSLVRDRWNLTLVLWIVFGLLATVSVVVVKK